MPQNQGRVGIVHSSIHGLLGDFIPTGYNIGNNQDLSTDAVCASLNAERHKAGGGDAHSSTHSLLHDFTIPGLGLACHPHQKLSTDAVRASLNAGALPVDKFAAAPGCVLRLLPPKVWESPALVASPVTLRVVACHASLVLSAQPCDGLAGAIMVQMLVKTSFTNLEVEVCKLNSSTSMHVHEWVQARFSNGVYVNKGWISAALSKASEDGMHAIRKVSRISFPKKQKCMFLKVADMGV
eukprot:1158581-Pelagomonas_calceolata.AAC.9